MVYTIVYSSTTIQFATHAYTTAVKSVIEFATLHEGQQQEAGWWSRYDVKSTPVHETSEHVSFKTFFSQNSKFENLNFAKKSKYERDTATSYRRIPVTQPLLL